MVESKPLSKVHSSKPVTPESEREEAETREAPVEQETDKISLSSFEKELNEIEQQYVHIDVPKRDEDSLSKGDIKNRAQSDKTSDSETENNSETKMESITETESDIKTETESKIKTKTETSEKPMDVVSEVEIDENDASLEQIWLKYLGRCKSHATFMTLKHPDEYMEEKIQQNLADFQLPYTGKDGGK